MPVHDIDVTVRVRVLDRRPWHHARMPTRRLRAVIVAVAVLATFAACGGGDDDDSASSDTTAEKADLPADDVRILRCSPAENAFSGFAAEVEIKNHTDVTSNYQVKVAFKDGTGAEVGNERVSVQKLSPDKIAMETVTSVEAGLADGVTCEVDDVMRFESR